MSTKTYSSNWWMFSLNGIIALFFGLLAIFSPINTLKVIIMYFGIILLITAIAMLIGVYSNMKKKLDYGTDLISALVTLGLGAVLTFFTEQTLEVFVVVLGVWAILIGIGQFMISAALKNKGDKRFILYSGIFTVAFGILLFFNPFAMAGIAVIITGVMAIIIGIVLISFGFRLKSL